MTDERLLIGKCGRPHGTRGEVRVWLENPESEILAPGRTLWACGEEPRPLVVERARPRGRFWVVAFAEVTTREGAEALRHHTLRIDPEDLPEVEEDEFYHAELLDLPVFPVSDLERWEALAEDASLPDELFGESLGRIAGFLETGANDVMIVEGGPERLLVPMIEDVVLLIDLETERVAILDPAHWLEP